MCFDFMRHGTKLFETREQTDVRTLVAVRPAACTSRADAAVQKDVLISSHDTCMSFTLVTKEFDMSQIAELVCVRCCTWDSDLAPVFSQIRTASR
jgi:hypothetical protein